MSSTRVEPLRIEEETREATGIDPDQVSRDIEAAFEDIAGNFRDAYSSD